MRRLAFYARHVRRRKQAYAADAGRRFADNGGHNPIVWICHKVMTIHLIKLAVGIETADHLHQVQKQRITDRVATGGEPLSYHVTRNFPRKAKELLNGGSLYWVIRGVILLRQPILRLDKVTDDRGKTACRIVLADNRIAVRPRTFRAFQGWRYFPVSDAPPDIGGMNETDETLPKELWDHLWTMGLAK